MEKLKTLLINIDNAATKDLLIKALNTFWQAALVVLLFGAEQVIDLLFKGDWYGLYTALLALLFGAAAAGLSALKTLIVNVLHEYKKSSTLKK